MLMSGRIIPTILGKGQRFPGFGHLPLLGLLTGLGTFMVPLRVSFHLLIEDQGLVLSALLVPFDFNQFRLCPWAMSFFQKLCPAPFPPVTVPLKTELGSPPKERCRVYNVYLNTVTPWLSHTLSCSPSRLALWFSSLKCTCVCVSLTTNAFSLLPLLKELASGLYLSVWLM